MSSTGFAKVGGGMSFSNKDYLQKGHLKKNKGSVLVAHNINKGNIKLLSVSDHQKLHNFRREGY